MAGSTAPTPPGEGEIKDNPAPFVLDVADAGAWGQSFMRRLEPGDQLALASLVRRERFPRGTLVFREGEPGEVLYIVWTGRVAVVKEDSSGQPALLGYRGPGEVVGEMGVLGGRPRSASVLAVEACDLLAIRAADFRQLMAHSPGIGEALMQVLTDRLRAADTARTAILREEQKATRRVDELTREIEHLAVLIRARKESVDLIATDLRSPLFVIQGALDLLQAMLPDEELASAAGVLDLARRSTMQILSVLEALLEAAHHDEGREAIDLVPLFRAALEGRAVPPGGESGAGPAKAGT